MNAANSCGDPSFGFAEILSRVACISADPTISLIAAFSFVCGFLRHSA
jgi:hypothetical protein